MKTPFVYSAIKTSPKGLNKLMNKLKIFFKDIIRNNGVLLIFLLFAVGMAFLGVWSNSGLHPGNEKVLAIVEKFSVNNYVLPYFVAERYLTWFNMRTFFFWLDYLLTLLGIVASLMTVFYASTDVQPQLATQAGEPQQPNPDKKRKSIIVFLSLLSLSFTIANIFIDSGTMANMSQHAWRELDICIMETIQESELSEIEKNAIIIDKVAEMERYIELFEH